jgi:hypothetical protein
MNTLSSLFNAAVVVGTLALPAFAATPTTTHAHNGFACVRPSYAETWVTDGGTPRTGRVFTGFRLCREQLPVDEDGYLVFPEA